jgi:hypothetical protein
MTTIVVETRIAAPIELCFDLARDVDAHLKTSSSTGERAVAGEISGLLELGDVVTFEAVCGADADTLTWRSPLGFLGVIADRLLVEQHMRRSMARSPESGNLIRRYWIDLERE